jgi:hypothetical protein|tara:strand:+ start:1348 stop:1680 length:333 start_codon:yes stop_codon:yes gene_type:complete
MANSFKRKTSAGIGTGFTPIDSYTVAGSTEVTVIGLTVANVTAGSVKADVSLFDGASYISIVKEAPIPSGGSLVVVGGDQKLVMETGDSMRIKSDTASSLDVIMSILEIT